MLTIIVVFPREKNGSNDSITLCYQGGKGHILQKKHKTDEVSYEQLS